MIKTIKINSCIISMMMSLFVPTACTNNDGLEEITDDKPNEQEYGKHVYKLHFEGNLQEYDGQITRSVSYIWPDKSRVYLTFFTGSSTSGSIHTYNSINGTATYNKAADSWTVTTTTALPSSQVLYGCNAYFFENKEKEQEPYRFILDETTPAYSGQGNYSYSQGNNVVVSVILSPSLWRMRFRGEPGTKVQMNSVNVALSGTFELLNTHAVSGSNNLPFSEPDKRNADSLNYSLTVGDNGYTPYVYGRFHSGYDYSRDVQGNEIRVTTDAIYQRVFNGADLLPGESGVLTVPTSSNFVAEGWTLMTPPDSDLWPDYTVALGKSYSEITSLYGNPLLYQDNQMGYYMHNDYISVVVFYLKNDKAWLVQLTVNEGTKEQTITNYLSSQYTTYKSGTDSGGDRFFSYINADTMDEATIGVSYYPDLKVIVYQSLAQEEVAPGSDDNLPPSSPARRMFNQ